MQRRHLEPFAVCKCGRAACFNLVTQYDVPQSYGRSAHLKTRNTPVCGECAEKWKEGAVKEKFSRDDETHYIPLSAEDDGKTDDSK